MLKLFENLQDGLSAGQDRMLVVTVESTGSSPRSAGAYMLVGRDGYICGTIGGGELEYRAIALARQLLEQGQSKLMDYDLSNDTAAGLGMICGGRTKVLFACFRAHRAEDLEFARLAVEHAENRKTYALLLPLNGETAQIRQDPLIPRRAFGYREGEASYYAEQFNFDGKVYIYGAGHLSRELVPLLSHLGFSCIVSDDREEFASAEFFPHALAVNRVDFANLRGPVEESDYIIIATRGHLADGDCIRFALSTPAKYIGVVGSRRKVKHIRENLTAEGYTEADIDRIVSPIGISIDSETPAEIAVSIAAQLIQVRAKWSK